MRAVAMFLTALALTACPRHIVDEDGGPGGGGAGQGGFGGSNPEMGGGGGGAGGCACVGGGAGGGSQAAGGGSAAHGLEIFVDQVDTDAGYVTVNFLTDFSNSGQILREVDCGTHCLIDPPPSTFVAMFSNLGNHYSYGRWQTTGFPDLNGWHQNLDFTGHDYTRVTVTVTGHNFIFYTTSQYPPGALGDGDGGVNVADELCNQDAVQRDLPGHYIAWLSTSKQRAVDRLPPGVRGWVSANYGDTTIQGHAGIAWEPVMDRPTDGWIFWPVSAESLVVATGTNDWGEAGANCDDWVSNDAGTTFIAGSSGAGMPGWTGGLTSCDTLARLYCLEIDHQTPLDDYPIETPQHAAFVTAGVYPSGGGLAGFDQNCQAEATGAGVPGTFKAMVATLAASAPSRIVANSEDLNGYDRLDGAAIQLYPWANFAIDVTVDRRTLVPFDPLRPANARLLQGDDRVWAGAYGLTLYGGPNCLDWFASTANATTMITRAGAGVWTAETATCDQQLHLFCLQTN